MPKKKNFKVLICGTMLICATISLNIEAMRNNDKIFKRDYENINPSEEDTKNIKEKNLIKNYDIELTNSIENISNQNANNKLQKIKNNQKLVLKLKLNEILTTSEKNFKKITI